MGKYLAGFIAFVSVAAPLILFWMVVLHALILGVDKGPSGFLMFLGMILGGVHMVAALDILDWATER